MPVDCSHREAGAAQPKAPVERFEKPAVAADLTKPARTYRASEKFEVGERVEHPSFGQGVVEIAEPGKITVFFASGRRVLVQSKEARHRRRRARRGPSRSITRTPPAASPSARPDGEAQAASDLLGPIIVHRRRAAIAGARRSGTSCTRGRRPGAVIDTIAIDDERELVVRARGAAATARSSSCHANGDREVAGADPARTPARPGDPAVAWSADRGHRARRARRPRRGVRVRARDAAKLGGFRLAPEHEPITIAAAGADHADRSRALVRVRRRRRLAPADRDRPHDRRGRVEARPRPGRRSPMAGVEAGAVWSYRAEDARFRCPTTGAAETQR